MTKEITKARILQELQDKFGLRELIPEKFAFSEIVTPTYDIAPHLTKWEVEAKTLTITSATSFLYFTVPQTERWTLRGYMIIFGATGAHKGSGLFAQFRPTVNDYIYFDLTKGQDVSYVINLPTPVILEPGNRLYYMIDDYTSDQSLIINIDVMKEELR